MLGAVLFLSAVLCVGRSNYIVMFGGEPHLNRMSVNALSSSIIETQEMMKDGEEIRTMIPNGYMAYMSEATAARIGEHPNVKIVEKDSQIHITEFRVREFPGDKPIMDKILIQKHAPWGLAHVGGSISLSHGIYRYPLNSGKGVDIYILDTGVEIDHPEFSGRARWGANFVPGSPDEDEHGHGTHCAGIAGGKNFGITKKSNIIAVKVLDKHGTGMISRLLQGIAFVIKEHEDKKDDAYDRVAGWHLEAEESSTTLLEQGVEDFHGFSSTWTPMAAEVGLLDLITKDAAQPKTVVNMSVGGFKSAALNFAIEYGSKLGIHFSTAAGNEHENACKFSPSSSKEGMTTGASTYRDTVAFFSNFGSCVDIFAPGVDILSSWIGGTQKLASGTSMAAPHTTGVMAAYLTYYEYDPVSLKHQILVDAPNVIRATRSLDDIEVSTLWRLPSFFSSSRKRLPMLSMERLLGKIMR